MSDKANNISENLKLLFSQLEDHISTKTVVGDPVKFGDIILIPLVDVAFGMATGMAPVKGESTSGAGGGGLGAKMTPAAVLVINSGTVQLVNVKNQESVNKMIDLIPGILSKLNLGSLFEKRGDKSKNSVEEDINAKTENEA